MSYGPFEAVFLDNYDGDTVSLLIFTFPGDQKEYDVRLNGVDCPERYADDPKEAELAEQAKEFTFEKCRYAGEVAVLVHGWGKYAGRVIGTVYCDGRELGEELMTAGLAEPYPGAKP